MCIYLFILNNSDLFEVHKSAAEDPNYSTSVFNEVSDYNAGLRYISITFKDCDEGTHFWAKYGGTLPGHVPSGGRNYFSKTSDKPPC